MTVPCAQNASATGNSNTALTEQPDTASRLAACGREPTVEERSEFDPYFQRFEQLSKQYGRKTQGDDSVRILFGVRFTDLGPFRAIRWESLERLGMRDRGYGWTVEMQARAARAGLSCAEVPVRHRRRAAGRSKVAGTLAGVLGAGTKIPLTIFRVRLGG